MRESGYLLALLLLMLCQPVLAQEPPEEKAAAVETGGEEGDAALTEEKAEAAVEEKAEAAAEEKAEAAAEEKADLEDPDEVEEDDLVQDDDSPSLIDQLRAQARTRTFASPPLKKYPYLEWHGYFRLRADLFTDVDLRTYAATSETEYTATSHFLPPLVKNYTNSSGGATFAEKLDSATEKTLGTANLRLRLSPRIRVSDTIVVGTTVDFLDNIVLGSTPEYLGNVSGGSTYYGAYPGPGVPLDAMSATQVPPSAGVNSLQDSVRVKEAYAEWIISFDEEYGPDSFSLGTLKVGRYAFDWGLGILHHRGDYERDNTSLTTLERLRALDSEWGSYLDRAAWSYDFGPVGVLAGFGWLASGVTSRVGSATSKQPYDIEEKDDMYQVELALSSRPRTRRDFIARRKRLFSGKPVLDWGVYVAYRRQEMASQLAAGATADTWVDYVDSFGDLELVVREAWMVTPDLWLRLDWRPDPGTRVYAGLEGVFVAGNVGNVQGTKAGQAVELLQYGVALETNLTLGLISFGLDFGLASGDDGELMEAWLGRADPWGTDSRYSAFTFNRNYAVDMLLYREVLGGISNTAYIRPHFDFDIIPTEESAFGGLLAGQYALALEPDGYPGDSPHLGLEFDAQVFYEETNRFLAAVGFGVLFPFAGLDRPADFIISGIESRDAEWAWSLQGNLFFIF